MTDTKANANQKAWEIWQDAKREAARQQDVGEWQRLYRVTKTLNDFHPLHKQKTGENVT